MKKVLIIDDEEMVRKTLKNKFPPDEYEVIEARSLDEVFGVLNSVPAIDVAIVDLRLELGEEEGKETGLKVIKPGIVRWLSESKRVLSPPPVVIVLTAYPTILSCKKAMKDGAYDYLDKNEPDAYDKLMKSIEQGLKERSAPEEYGERRWLEMHFDAVVNENRGKRIAIHNEKVTASAGTIEELDTILMDDFPLIKPFIVYIPEIEPVGDPVFVEVADPFSVEWGNYLQLPPEGAERLKERAWEENKDWIREQLDAKGAEWILVCGREVIKWSDDLRKFPSQEELKKIADKKNLFPFVFSQPPLIEESSWPETIYENDYYPSLKINVCGNLELTADFDTGATNTLLDINPLISHDPLIGIFATFSEAKHLNLPYRYSRSRVCIEITDELGNRESRLLTCTCVRNWRNSPFCEINPDRKALVGRDILLEFPLEVRLDGRGKKTYIYIQ